MLKPWPLSLYKIFLFLVEFSATIHVECNLQYAQCRLLLLAKKKTWDCSWNAALYSCWMAGLAAHLTLTYYSRLSVIVSTDYFFYSSNLWISTWHYYCTWSFTRSLKSHTCICEQMLLMIHLKYQFEITLALYIICWLWGWTFNFSYIL